MLVAEAHVWRNSAVRVFLGGSMPFVREYAARATVLLCVNVFSASIVLAQTQGQITGVVTDPTGSIVIGATVTVTNPQTNVARQTATNSAGLYSFPSLQPGVYNVKVESSGFGTEVRNGVELQVDQVARLDFQLRVGQVSETVEVAGGTPLLVTESASL